MKRILIILLIMPLLVNINAQMYEIYQPKTGYSYPEKAIQVRFVYVLLSSDKPESPGNFTKTTDGGSGSNIVANGDEFADFIINTTNSMLRNPRQLNLGDSPPPIVKSGFVFEEAGDPIYLFHNQLYYYTKCEDPQAVSDLLDAINKSSEDGCLYIFLLAGKKNDPNGLMQGGCGDSPNVVRFQSVWYNYTLKKTQKEFNDWLPSLASLLSHEAGHLLGLNHVYCNCRDCDETSFEDIPTRDQLNLSPQKEEELCVFNSPIQENSNNLMAGVSSISNFSLTPDQIGQTHYYLSNNRIRNSDREFLKYWVDSYPSSKAINQYSTRDINRPYPVIAENITVSGDLPLHSDKPTVLIATKSFTFKKGTHIHDVGHFRAYFAPELALYVKNAKDQYQPGGKTSQSTLQVFPNPSDGHFTIISDNPESEISLKIYNSAGMLLQADNMENGFYELDLSMETAGVYILQSINEEGIQTKKIVIR